MTRARVFRIRLAATAFVLLLAFVPVRLLWFPGGYFGISGVLKLILVLVAVNLVIGPGLSTIVFKPGKPGLRFDLIVIAIVELIVLAWAMTEIHDRRPAFTVFAVDRFEVVTRMDVELAPLDDSRLAMRPAHAPRLIYAELPSDPEVMSQLIDDTVFLGRKDIDRRPEFWRPYAQGIARLKAAAKPLAGFLLPGDRRAIPVQRWLARHDEKVSDYVYLPIRAKGGDGIMIVHADIGYPVGVLAVDPWQAFVSAPQDSPPAGNVEQTHE